MDAISYIQHHLATATSMGWLIPVVSALGPNGKGDAIRWVRRTVECLLPLAHDDRWMHDRLGRELQAIASFDTEPPCRTELANRSEDLHQVPHQGAQPAVHNLLIAYANAQSRDDNQYVINLEASLRLILESVGNTSENRQIVIEELRSIAWRSSTELDSYQIGNV